MSNLNYEELLIIRSKISDKSKNLSEESVKELDFIYVINIFF